MIGFVNKTILTLTFLGLTLTQSAFSEGSFELSKNIVISGYLGASRVNNVASQSLVISPYLTDFLLNTKPKNNLSLSLSVKKTIKWTDSSRFWLQFGPSLNFQSLQVSGDIWEMHSPEFFNYRYRVVSQNFPILFEADLYFSQKEEKVIPFITAGAGIGVFCAKYQDYALPGIAWDTELTKEQVRVKPMVSIGAGLLFPFNETWGATVRYAFYYTDAMWIQLKTYTPLHFDENSHNLQLGINYKV